MKKYILLFALVATSMLNYAQTTYISVTGGGNWNSASTWDVDFDNTGGDGIPGANDLAIIIGDGAGGGNVNITSNVSVGDLFVVNDISNVLRKTGLAFATYTLTINGQLSGILNDLSDVAEPTTTVIENDSRLNIVFTNDNSSTPNITSWGHTSALRNVTINPTSSATMVQFDDVAIHTALDIDNGTLQVNSGAELIDGTSSSTITVASGNSLTLNGDVNGNGTSSSRFNAIVINGTLTTGISAYINTSNFTVGSSGVVNINYNNTDGTGQDEGWWFETNSPSTFTIDVGSTFTYGANQSQAIAPITYGNLTLSATTGLRTKTLTGSGTFNIQGDLIIANVSTELASAVTTELQLQGDVTNNGTWTTSANQDIRFNGSSTQTIGGNNPIVFNDDVFVANTLAFETDITFESNFTDNDNNLSFSEDFTFNGTTYDQGSGSFTLNGSSQTIAGTGTINFTDLTVSGATVANNGAVNLTGLLSMTSANFDADGSGIGSFTLISNSSGTASVGNLTGSAVSGNWTVQRFFDGTGDVWRNFGVGVNGATVTNITGSGFTINGNDLAHYDETETALGTFDDGWVLQSTFGSNLSNSRGYSMWTRDTEVTNTVEFVGTLNTGNQNMPVSRTAGPVDSANDGWNLVNNPFTSTIDWDLLSRSNLDGAVSVWNTSTSAYDTWNGSTGNLSSGLIASGQAFWVHSTSGTPTLTIQEADKVSTATSFLKEGEESLTNHLIVKLTQDDKVDKTYIHFRSDAMDDFEQTYDGRKLSNGIYNLSSKAASGESLSINSMGEIVGCEKTVELNITNISEGSYDLVFEDLVSFTSGLNITLKDKFLDTSKVLVEGDTYSFDVTADPTSYGDTRFELEFSAVTLETNLATSTINNCDQNFVSIYVENAQIGVKYDLMNGTDIVSTSTGNGGEVSFQISKALLTEGTNTYEVNIDNGVCGNAGADNSISFDFAALSEVTSVDDGSRCGMGSVVLSATGATIDGYYQWYESVDAIEPIADQNASSYNTPELEISKTYFVTAVNAQGCESTRVPVIATIGESPRVPELTISEGDCDFNTTTVYVQDSQIGAIYNLINTEGSIATGMGNGGQVALSISKSILEEGVNTLRVTVEIGTCGIITIEDAASIEKISVVEVAAVVGGSTCGIGSISISAEGALESGYYRWYESELAVDPIEGQNASVFNTPELDESKTYYVSIVNTQGCESTIRVPVNAIINEYPELPEIIEEGNVLVSTSKINNQWYKDGEVIEGATNNTYEVIESGSYSVEVANDVGCKLSSEGKIMTITTTLNDDIDHGQVRIFPNPIGDQKLKISFEKLHMYKSVSLYNSQGKLLLTQLVETNSEFQIEMSRFKKGVYFIHLIGEQGNSIHKLLKN